MRYITIVLFVLVAIWSSAQTEIPRKAELQKEDPMDSLPYHQIPAYPDTFTQATILARTLDGLGFRYYWATEGLTEADYTYSAGNESRSTREVLEHLEGLSDMIKNTVFGEANIRPRPRKKMSDYVCRRITLTNIEAAADYLRAHPDLDLSQLPIVFQRGENTSEMPHWHLLNGPIADALWHCGQVVGNRRASGNPIPSGVNVFMGRKE